MSQEKLNDLRKKYPEFVYESYKYKFDGDNLEIEFNFKIAPDIEFKPKLVIKSTPPEFKKNCDMEVLDNLIFNLGLVEIPSYWKSTCSPKIVIKAGHLDNDQVEWWHDLLISGMGQFYLQNGIDFSVKDFLTLNVTSGNAEIKKARTASEKVLIPIGGGKDSTVTLNILKEKFDIGLLVVNPSSPAAGRTVKQSGLSSIVVERKLDPNILILNKKGYLNGHTPISSVFHFISVLASYIFDYKYVAFSNERSAEEENVFYRDMKINHQYSKTMEFENKFRSYNLAYLSSVDVFSFLRPLHEIQIAKIFAKYDRYLNVIRSCNVGQQKDTWCLNCPKCLSTYLLLYPFVDKNKIIKMFGQDLYQRDDLLPLLNDLIDEDSVKPLECVGTKEELRFALYLSNKKSENDLPYLLKEANKYFAIDKNYDDLLLDWGEDQNIPDVFKNVLKNKKEEILSLALSE